MPRVLSRSLLMMHVAIFLPVMNQVTGELPVKARSYFADFACIETTHYKGEEAAECTAGIHILP